MNFELETLHSIYVFLCGVWSTFLYFFHLLALKLFIILMVYGTLSQCRKMGLIKYIIIIIIIIIEYDIILYTYTIENGSFPECHVLTIQF